MLKEFGNFVVGIAAWWRNDHKPHFPSRTYKTKQSVFHFFDRLEACLPKLDRLLLKLFGLPSS